MKELPYFRMKKCSENGVSFTFHRLHDDSKTGKQFTILTTAHHNFNNFE